MFQSLPYIDARNHREIKLLVVQPSIYNQEPIYHGAIMIPDSIGPDHESAIVIGCDKNSDFKPGDVVVYNKIDRTIMDRRDAVTIDGKDCDIIAEQEVWNRNDQPYNRVYIEPLSLLDVTESGIILPNAVQSAPEKGVVRSVPDNFFCKAGDIVEYRKNEKLIYHTTNIDGKVYDVLYEQDIFTINGRVSPHRIIIEIDKAAQRVKRQTSETGLIMSPLFIGMLYNLQYGKVLEIGTEAQKHYPELNVGDTAIIHHSIEDQPHRLLKETYGKHDVVTFERRMIEVFDPSAREIFGKVVTRKIFGKSEQIIVPFLKNIFLKWDFELLEKVGDMDFIIPGDLHLSSCHDIDTLKNTVSNQTRNSADSYKSRYQGYMADFELHRDNSDRVEAIGTAINRMKYEAERVAKYVKRDHLLVCKQAYPMTPQNEVITPYKYLYPINIMGKKYLIAHADYLLSRYNSKNMGIEKVLPIADRLLVKSIDESVSDLILIPDGSQEKPQKAEVIAVGNEIRPEEMSVGDVIYHRKMMGVGITLEGVEYLMLQRKDVFLKVAK